MDIILDTNILRNDLFFKSKDFEVLKDYLKKTDSHFILPKIILQEIQGIYKRTIEENVQNFDKSRKSLNTILNKQLIGETSLNIDKEVEDYIKFIYQKLELKERNIVPYKNEYLPEIIERAIQRKKPFKDEDKGFRDAIIWLSIIDYCKKCHEKQVIFISNNPKDFGDANIPNELHPDLKKEIEDLGIRVNYFRTTKDFIEQHSKKIDFIDLDWVAKNVNEDWVSDLICDFLNEREQHLVISWYESAKERESTNHYKALKASILGFNDLFIYEMVDDSLIINVAVEAEVEMEFEFYEYDSNYYETGYRYTSNETQYYCTNFYISIGYHEDEITELEITDFG